LGLPANILLIDGWRSSNLLVVPNLLMKLIVNNPLANTPSISNYKMFWVSRYIALVMHLDVHYI
jgi:hypothetical protein